jgi:cytochrome c oxidase subunit 4
MGATVTEHTPSDAAGAQAGAAAHALPKSVLIGAAATLLTLTAVTVATSRLDLGGFNVVLALAIACLKASLVALFFMHLKYESRFKALVFVSAVLFAALFIGFVIFDTTQYQPDVRAQQAQSAPQAR